jgi:hypothetical protein
MDTNPLFQALLVAFVVSVVAAQVPEAERLFFVLSIP